MRLKCAACLVVSGMMLVAVSANGQKQSSPASISEDGAVRHLSEEVHHKGWIVFCTARTRAIGTCFYAGRMGPVCTISPIQLNTMRRHHSSPVMVEHYFIDDYREKNK